MDMLPPKITLISPFDPHYRDWLDNAHLDKVLGLPVLLVVASSFDPKTFCTLSDHVQQYDGSHITSLHWQGDETISPPSNLMIITGDFHDLRDLCDPRGLHDQLC
jgi:hypothetical protein